MPPSAPLVAVHVRNEMEVLSARVRMLERENDRLKRMLGDVVIEKEVLQLAIRDGVQEAGLRVAASVRTA